ncbi:MAG: RNase adapter RapZ [Geminicoccaceae bacterium]
MTGGRQSRRLVIVTGMAGAGRTSALKRLEDQGFEAIDNLPIPLIERFVRLDEGLERDLAIGIDSRTRAFDPRRLARLVERLARTNPAVAVTLLFCDCDDEVLQRRFTETRRRHPLAADRPVQDGIAAERALLAPLRAAADKVIDTTQLSLPELHRLLAGYFPQAGDAPGLTVSLVSFAYRRGLPREADLVIDVRFLQNPHYVAALKPLTGLNPAVQAHVRADPGFDAFMERLEALVVPLLPRYRAEGKSYLTIAIGCTGGQHRSVFVVMLLADTLRRAGYEVSTSHRELKAPGEGPAAASGAATPGAQSGSAYGFGTSASGGR